jgi:CDP-diacylglycerol--glycerol-3-phosphate 3-phosphatidyltransferase
MGRRSALENTVLRVAGLGAVALVGVGPLLPAAGAGSLRFCAAGLLAWAWFCRQLWRLRGLNVASGAEGDESAPGPLRPQLGAATAVTLLRSWLIAIVAGHLLLPPVTGDGSLNVGLLYSLAALLDGVDGRVARRGGIVTRLGARLDVLTDSAGLLVVPLVAVHAGRLPPWYLLLSFAYPLFRTALTLQRWRGRPLYLERLRRDPRARFFAGVQMGVVAASFYPVLPVTLVWGAASLAMVPTLLLFAREWAVVNGWWSPGPEPSAARVAPGPDRPAANTPPA